MKNVLNFPNYNTFFLSTKKKVFNGMSRIIAYSKSHFMLKICIFNRMVNNRNHNIKNTNMW